MNRHIWVLIHRYAGLTTALFLIVVGLTGSVLAFYYEIDGWINPNSHRDQVTVPVDLPLLDPFDLCDRALGRIPQARINSVDLQPKPGKAYLVSIEARIDSATRQPYPLGFDNIKLNPYTGVEITRGKTMLEQHYWPLTRENVMEFIYLLHMQLALRQIGGWVLGITALIWTIDCFVGFYLTLPPGRKKSSSFFVQTFKMLSIAKSRDDGKFLSSESVVSPHLNLQSLGEGTACSEMSDLKGGQRSFWMRWKPSWFIKWRASSFRIYFDLHRAFGLWTWILLFVFAWSSVLFNLPQVYNPVMGLLFEMPPDEEPMPVMRVPRPDPPVDLRTAHAIGQRLLNEQAKLHGFKVISEQLISYDPSTGFFSYVVEGDDLFAKEQYTSIVFDAKKAKVIRSYYHNNRYLGGTLGAWLSALHMAKIGGLPYQIFVCFMGLVITMLSVTGIYIWLKKRRAAKTKHNKISSAVNMPRLNN